MNLIQQLKTKLRSELPQARLVIDPADREGGAWWLDATFHGHQVTVEWKPSRGLGISSSLDVSFGEGADEIYQESEIERASQRIVTILRERLYTS